MLTGERDAPIVDGGFTLEDGRKLAAAIQATGKRLTTAYVSQSDPRLLLSLPCSKQPFKRQHRTSDKLIQENIVNQWKVVASCMAVVMFVAGCSGSSDSNAPSAASQNEALESQNKELVRRVYTEVIGQNKSDLVSELFAADYIQHDSTVPSGPAGQITLVENLKTKFPGLVATIKHIGADGDYVAVHWHASATPDNEATGQAAIDLYRVSDGKIAEHWDAFQDVPATTASGNSMFSDQYVYKQPKQDVTEVQEEANEKMAVNAYKGLFDDRNVGLLDQYWDPGYLQHNPQLPNGVEGLPGFIESLPPGVPKLDFIQTLADDDLVYTISTNSVLTDIFRVVDNKIVEHWDVVP